ncbi:MAG: CapA family protein [Clostridia bacterium]|nr:CapA family protein [Clostridia bacterium]
MADTVSLLVIGDVMMHRGQIAADYSCFLRDLAPLVEQADFRVANMEFSLGGEPYTGYPCFSAPDAYARYVKDLGFNVFLVANNHIFDRGEAGLRRTLCIYRDSLQVPYTGIGAKPLLLEKKGLRIALVNFTYGLNGHVRGEQPRVNRMDGETVRKTIEDARSEGAHFVIALPHWGEEYRLRHSPEQETWAEFLVACGVDAIVGAHPHVVQDTTHIRGVPVLYSLGNAVSNMSAPNTRLELAVTLRFVRDLVQGGQRMLEPELTFLWCTLPGKLTASYATIRVQEWATRRSEWLIPSDYDNMLETLARVRRETGIGQ